MDTPHDPSGSPQIHQNIMELLVQEEIQKQIRAYPVSMRSHINRVDVATYALNRLPPLYASSEKGKEQQKESGKEKYHKEITLVVRRALAAIEREPIRGRAPIMTEDEFKWQEAQNALEELEILLKEKDLIDNSQQNLTWESLVSVVQQALNKVAWRGKRD